MYPDSAIAAAGDPQALEAGFALHLNKPADHERLVKAMADLTAGGEFSAPGAQP